MATITLTITSERTKDKETKIVGTALMDPGDTRLEIQLISDHIAPTGRRLKVTSEILLEVEPN